MCPSQIFFIYNIFHLQTVPLDARRSLLYTHRDQEYAPGAQGRQTRTWNEVVEELGLKSEGFATHEPLTKKLLLERGTTHWQVTDLQHNTSMLHSAHQHGFTWWWGWLQGLLGIRQAYLKGRMGAKMDKHQSLPGNLVNPCRYIASLLCPTLHCTSFP